MEILRNMWRRKFRTFLTIFGIVIGIFAFTVMGSMALKLNKMIDGGKRYITGQITILPKGADFATGQMGGMLPIDTLNKIAKVDGVEAVAGSVEFSLDEPNLDDPTGGAQFGMPASIEGMDLDSNFKNRNWENLDMREGRMIERGDPDNYVTVGITVALDKNWKVSDKVDIRGRQFEVVGIVEKTMTGPDSYVFMPLKAARILYIESNPFLKSLKEQSEQAMTISERDLSVLPEETKSQILQARAFKVEDVSTAAAASWKDGVDSDVVSNRIKEQFKNEALVLSPKKMGEEIDKASATMNAVILGSALLALVVGLFSIVNTMIMSISERTKEIGIKKALGASNNSIALEYTLEAGLIGALGGLIGMGFGAFTAYSINRAMESKGAEIFSLEPTFFAWVLLFSFAVGVVAGIIPAMRAAKLKVVEAIREL
jgi:putative ABC transport system permease protein